MRHGVSALSKLLTDSSDLLRDFLSESLHVSLLFGGLCLVDRICGLVILDDQRIQLDYLRGDRLNLEFDLLTLVLVCAGQEGRRELLQLLASVSTIRFTLAFGVSLKEAF